MPGLFIAMLKKVGVLDIDLTGGIVTLVIVGIRIGF
jgi:hypothetical protein